VQERMRLHGAAGGTMTTVALTAQLVEEQGRTDGACPAPSAGRQGGPT
jgi:hypothetical protein